MPPWFLEKRRRHPGHQGRPGADRGGDRGRSPPGWTAGAPPGQPRRPAAAARLRRPPASGRWASPTWWSWGRPPRGPPTIPTGGGRLPPVETGLTEDRYVKTMQVKEVGDNTRTIGGPLHLPSRLLRADRRRGRAARQRRLADHPRPAQQPARLLLRPRGGPAAAGRTRSCSGTTSTCTRTARTPPPTWR